MSLSVGDSIARDFDFDEEGIASFARLVGDTNPLHRDAAFAAATRFGGIIASGPQVTSLMMAMTADWLTSVGPGVGLGFTFRLRSAVRAGELVRVTWRVVSAVPKASLRGVVLGVTGEAVRPGGAVAVEASGEILAMDEA